MPWAAVERTPTRTASARGCGTCSRCGPELPHLHAASPTEIWDPRDPGVLLVVRRHPSGPLLAASNATAEEAWVAADVLHWLGLHTDGLHDAITDSAPELRDGAVRLAPYATVWLHDRDRLEG